MFEIRVPTNTRHRQAGFTLIEVMVVVVILGILAALAIPALSKYMRRTKTSEARLALAKMFDGASAYFHETRTERGAVALIGAGAAADRPATHRCPAPDPAGGEAGITPDLTVNCNDGEDGKCLPGETAGGAGTYSIHDWGTPTWQGVGFQMEQPHFFHYNFVAVNGDTAGYGNCQFTAQAFADLDDDGTFSTFERAGAADRNGINGAAGLYLDQEVE